MVDLMKACKRFNLEHASFDYFEANEGKNISDKIGLIVETAYVRGMLKHEQVIRCVKDIVSVIKSKLKKTTKKFMYFLVEEFGKTEHINSREQCPINGIMKLHSLVPQDDKVILLLWTCKSCTVSVICHECKGRKGFVKPSDVFLGNDDDSILKDIIELQDIDDEGQLMLRVMTVLLVMKMWRKMVSLQEMLYGECVAECVKSL